MASKNIRVFKSLYILGIIFIFFSLFFDWYSYRILFNNEIIVFSTFNLFDGWKQSNSGLLNVDIGIEDVSVPLILNLMLVGITIASTGIVLFMSIEETSALNKHLIYAYINGALLLLVVFYTVIFPIIYLLPQDLYFPYLQVINSEYGFTSIYSVELGYILQLFSFPLLFPYTVFYYRTITQYEQEDHTVEKQLSKIVEKYQEYIDFDTLIAKEEIKLNFDH